MLHENTKTKIRNAVELMSRKRGYFQGVQLVESFGLRRTLLTVLNERGFVHLQRGKNGGTKYIGPRPISENELNSIIDGYYIIRYNEKKAYKSKKAKKNVQSVHKKPAAPKQAAAQPQKNRVRLLWGLIDFTY